MGQKTSKQGVDPPRVKWTYLMANMHEFRLLIDITAKTISITEWREGSPEVIKCSLELDIFRKTGSTSSEYASVCSLASVTDFNDWMGKSHLESFREEAHASLNMLVKL